MACGNELGEIVKCSVTEGVLVSAGSGVIEEHPAIVKAIARQRPVWQLNRASFFALHRTVQISSDAHTIILCHPQSSPITGS